MRFRDATSEQAGNLTLMTTCPYWMNIRGNGQALAFFLNRYETAVLVEVLRLAVQFSAPGLRFLNRGDDVEDLEIMVEGGMVTGITGCDTRRVIGCYAVTVVRLIEALCGLYVDDDTIESPYKHTDLVDISTETVL